MINVKRTDVAQRKQRLFQVSLSYLEFWSTVNKDLYMQVRDLVLVGC